MEKLHGLIAAAFTPFKCGQIDVDVVPPYAEYLAANGISGVFVNGTTGEGNSLTLRERVELADAWLKAAPSGLKVIVHVGNNALPDCREMARHAQENGAWGIAAMAPSFFKPSLPELVEFVAEIADVAPRLPFYYYHMPSMTGLRFPMIDFLRTIDGRAPTLAGIKFTYEDLMDYALCANYRGGRYDMVFGRDEILLCGLSLGATAAIGSTYNFAAPLYLKMLEQMEQNQIQEAHSLQLLSMRLVSECIQASPRALPAIRALTEWRSGIDLGPMRAPVSPIDEESLARLQQCANGVAGSYLSQAHTSPVLGNGNSSGAKL